MNRARELIIFDGRMCFSLADDIDFWLYVSYNAINDFPRVHVKCDYIVIISDEIIIILQLFETTNRNRLQKIQ